MVDSSLCKLVAVLRRHVCSLSLWRDVGGALCATKVHKIVGMDATMPHFLFGGRNILNGDGVVDGCGWRSLLYKVGRCWLDVMVLDGVRMTLLVI